MKHAPSRHAGTMRFAVATTLLVLLAVTLIMTMNCGRLQPPRIRLEDRHIACFINATKNLSAQSPEFLGAMNNNKGDLEKQGSEQFGRFEAAVKQAGCESYAEYTKVSFEVFTAMSVIYAEAFMKDMDRTAKKMHEEALAACESSRSDPVFYEACVSQTRKQIAIAEGERQKELAKNKPYADMVLNRVKGMTDPHNAAVVMRHIDRLGTMWSPHGISYVK